MKTLLILADGMRPDSLEACGHPFAKKILEHSKYSLNAKTVMPSVTLPCHMSLFHSVKPERHGILTNTYVPQVRPIKGICEVLRAAGKKNAVFYNWEELKDLSRPDSLAYSNYVSGHVYKYEEANGRLTENAISYINSDNPDFVFLYLGWTDAAGHGSGWMSEEYLKAVYASIDDVEKCINSILEEYLVIVTADHGGHDRTHGTDLFEDMTIPIICYNKSFESEEIADANIIDIAPTITTLLGVAPNDEWEGKALFGN